MATVFPPAPTVGEEFTGLGGITYVWDGVKWVTGVCGGSVSNALDSIIAGQCIGLVNTPGPPQTLTISALIPCIQTPWLQNIDGGMHQLSNAIGIGIAGAAPNAGIRLYSGGIGVNAPAPTSPQIVITGRATDIVPGLFINTTNPTAQPMVSISNDIRQANIIYYGSGSPNPGALSLEMAGANDYIRFYTSGGTAGERMRITNTGLVGVNTATPGTTLDVFGRLRSISNGLNPTSGAGVELFWDSTNIKGWLIGYDRSASAWKPMEIDGLPLILNTSSAGFVGIQTPTPGAALEVSAGSGIMISADPVSSGGGVNYQIYRDGPTGRLFFVGHQATFTGYQFEVTSSSSAVVPVVTIANSGGVGIGTTTPQGILDISGNGVGGAGIYMYYTGNTGNWYPTFNGSNLAIGWNFAAGLQEVDFFNTTAVGGATGGFRWYQQTSASAATLLAGIDATGNMFADRFEAASAYFGPAATNSGPMLFTPNADPGGGMAVQTTVIWADITNSRLVLEFKTAAGVLVRGYVPVA